MSKHDSAICLKFYHWWSLCQSSDRYYIPQEGGKNIQKQKGSSWQVADIRISFGWSWRVLPKIAKTLLDKLIDSFLDMHLGTRMIEKAEGLVPSSNFDPRGQKCMADVLAPTSKPVLFPRDSLATGIALNWMWVNKTWRAPGLISYDVDSFMGIVGAKLNV